MNPQRWQQIKLTLHHALELQGEARSSYLAEITADDPELRREVESLIAAHEDSADSFLNVPAAALQADADSTSLGPETVIGNYRLVCEIGQGGMGQVWLAEQTAPVRRFVALKLIRAGMYDAMVAQRFQTERQSLAMMDHPAIAKVFDAGATPQGQPYLVMEYVQGLPITEYCDANKLGIRERIELFVLACDGVQHAHQKAIIHRDLKPANILIVEVDGKALPRIIDFGLARPSAPRLGEQSLHTRFGQFIGTPGYMSPEQIDPQLRDIDTRSDVYSLGVILYVLLVGSQPFASSSERPAPLDEWLRRLREEEAPSLGARLQAERNRAPHIAAARAVPPRQLSGLLRGELSWIVAKALARDRERRYGTPSELAADLRRYLDGRAVAAGPASTRYRFGKFVRRHRWGVLAAATAAALLILASAAGLLAIRQKHEAEYQAAQARQAQSRLLTEAAAQRLKNSDVEGAQALISEVLNDPAFARTRSPAALGVFQEIRAASVQMAVIAAHRDTVWRAAFSPDGTRIVTASDDKSARLWDARSGAPLGRLEGHGDAVYFCAYSPDGTRIATSSRDRTARVWDARTGALMAVMSGHGLAVYSVGFSADGTRIVTASADKTARIWDARTGAELVALRGHTDRVEAAAFSPDGKRVVTASLDRTARIWDARSGAMIGVLSGHGDALYSASYSPDGARIVTGSRDNTARIWDAGSGRPLAVLAGDDEVVYSAVYSPDGARIATASADNTVRLWDAGTGAQLAVLAGHRSVVYSVAFAADGGRLVTASADKTARVWDATLGGALEVLSGHLDRVYGAVYSPDGARIATASQDRSARIWDAGSGATLAVLSGHENIVQSVAYSPDGSRVVTAAYGNTARLWDAKTGAPLATLSGHQGAVYSAAYSPNGARIVTASQDKTVRIWDARSGAPLKEFTGHAGAVYAAAYSPDGARIATASDDKTVRIWDASSGQTISVLVGHDAAVYYAAYSPDGKRLVSASADLTARIWDAGSGAVLAVLSGHGDVVNGAWFSPDGLRILTASTDRTARIWDASSAQPLLVLSGHRAAVYSAAYAPDGKRVVTASGDATARIWDARVQAGLEEQILWSRAAEFAPLSATERSQFGIPDDERTRHWPADALPCDRTAAAPYDPDRVAPGVELDADSAALAASACAKDIEAHGGLARLAFQQGAALWATRDLDGARRHFEAAVAQDYRAARVGLARVLIEQAAGASDARRAVSLYEQAWQSGVAVAAFELARVYEFGIHGNGAGPTALVAADPTRAWAWYAKGAQAGEPNALARLAQRDEAIASGLGPTAQSDQLLLQAFGRYAAAVEIARDDGWPDEAWRGWRYHRATLARLLARDGMMQDVASAYAPILERRAQRPASPGGI